MEVEEKRLALVDWLNSIVPHFYLSLKATDEELRASFVDGVALCQILSKLKPGFMEEGADCLQSPECRSKRITRFLAAVTEMGLPSFEKSDLDNGTMKPVLDCLSALKEKFMPHFVGIVSRSSPDRQRGLFDSKFQRSVHSPSETPSTLIHGGHKFHEVFQLKQGLYADLTATRISELMRSNSFDNAPTQSLLSVVNGILDESIERRNTKIPQRVACLLRKVVQEIERRISTQAEHLRTQSNLFKAREEKYKSRIKILEALATGTVEESEIVLNQLQYIKAEKIRMGGENKQKEDDEVAKLKQENCESNVEISSLKQELELAKKKHELHYLEMENQAAVVKGELEKRLKEKEELLEYSKKKLKELEASADSKCQRWSKKEHMFESFIHDHYAVLRELKHSFETVRQEVLKTQKCYVEELKSVGTKIKGLAEAAQKYHAILCENRKIYNELQDLKGNIRVYCRIRPFLRGENRKETVVECVGEDGEITIVNPSKQGEDGQKSFRFNKVFGPTATQAEVFSDTQPLVRTVLDGYNVCIFAYGQTGSGKTYTMTGPEEATREEWGVNYRALDDLFQVCENRRNYFLYEIGVQMIEIYNETIQDLLSSDGSRKKLGILTTQSNGLAVPEASMYPVRSTSDVIDLMTAGHQNRSVGATAMNERSSRSHSIVTIHVQGTDIKTSASTRGTLHLVDLAGSERVDRSEATGDRLREAQHINKSLSALGDVIFSLAQKSPHVPYRNSKLTQVLQTSLGGRAKTLMFVQVNPDISSYSETCSTLKFAERVSGVELGAARSNKEGRDVKELMDQAASLKDMIGKKDEEIERLQQLKDTTDPQSTVKLGPSSLRYGSPSSSAGSIGGSPQQSASILGGKRPGIQKAASDQEISESNEGVLRSSKSTSDLKHQKEYHRENRLSGGDIGSEDDDTDEKLSEISDGDLHMPSENDGDLKVNNLSKSSKQAEKAEGKLEMTKTVRLSSPRPRLAGPTTTSRLSQVKTKLRAATALKKTTSGGSSSITPARSRT